MSRPAVQATGSKIYLTWEDDGIKMVVRKISDKSTTIISPKSSRHHK